MIVVGAGGGASASSGQATAAASNCKVARNVEAIIDDSGSMDFTDPTKNRTELLNAINSLAGNTGKKLGAVEFGDTADTLFPPTNIPVPAGTLAAGFALVVADNGSTDYNLAFNTATAANSTADARIFLSDGGHNVGPYNNAHLTPNIKTYTVGFGATDPTLLTQIAGDTGGQAYDLADSSLVPAVAASITAGLNCKAPPITITKSFSKQGQSFTLGFKATGKTADVLITWPIAGDIIVPSIGGGGGNAASVAKVKLKAKRGTTFSSARINGLKKGKRVKFKIKATALPVPTVATTQIIR